MVLSAPLVLAVASAALAQPPVFTQLPPSTSFQCIGLEISDDGKVVAGFLGGNSSFIWRQDMFPQIEVVSGTIPGPVSAVSGMDSTGTRFLFSYRDPDASSSATYPTGLSNTALFESGAFTLLPAPLIAQPCDASLNTATALSGDGQTAMSMAWNRCSVAPFAWHAGTGWTAWATQPEFPPFGQTGYQSHKVTSLSNDGTRGCGWYQSGTGYGGRTALVWTNNGATVSRIDPAPHSVLWGEPVVMSANGQYVVGSGIPEDRIPNGEGLVNGNKYLYRWSEATGVEVLPGRVETAPGSMRHAVVGGVSNNGRIIVGQDSFGGDREAFIWTPEGGGQKLTAYLAARGLNLMDQFVTLTSATAITGDGRFVTGQWADFGGSFGAFVLDLGAQGCGPADLGGQGGVAESDGALDNNDFVVFIDMFFNHNPAADVGRQGGLPGSDGEFDNNDFVVFIDLFFAGC